MLRPSTLSLRAQHTLRRLRPPRPDIAVPPIPPGLEWVGEPVESIDRLVAARPGTGALLRLRPAQLGPHRCPTSEPGTSATGRTGLKMLGVHSPRFPFTQDPAAVAAATWSVSASTGPWRWTPSSPSGGSTSRTAGPRLFLWGQGGALRWYHLGEGDYAGTEEAIREALCGVDGDSRLAAPAGADQALGRPRGEGHRPHAGAVPRWLDRGARGRARRGRRALELDYEAGGAYAATEGEGSIAVRARRRRCERRSRSRIRVSRS